MKPIELREIDWTYVGLVCVLFATVLLIVLFFLNAIIGSVNERYYDPMCIERGYDEAELPIWWDKENVYCRKTTIEMIELK